MTNENQQLKAGDLVRYAVAAEPGDAELVMKVLEVNGNRLLVEAQVDMTIKPTNVVRASDVAKA